MGMAQIFDAQLEEHPGIGTWTYLTCALPRREDFSESGKGRTVRANWIAVRDSLDPNKSGV
jgi:hypothetical protein